jgi:hypothetical protein
VLHRFQEFIDDSSAHDGSSSNLLCFGHACSATSIRKHGTLEGNVSDAAEDAPIQTAFIFVHRSGTSDVSARPDGRGDFQLNLAPGLYDIFVAADGFAPRCKVIEMKASQVTSYRVKLKPDAEHLQADRMVETHPIH